jgi:hypothetical protein
MYTRRTIGVKGNCTPAAVYAADGLVHPMYMAPRESPAYGTRHPVTGLRIPYLRAYREAARLTQHKVADLLAAAGLPLTYVSIGRMERGEQPYNQRVLEALGRLYKANPLDMVEFAPGAGPRPSGGHGGPSGGSVSAIPTKKLIEELERRTRK